MPTTGPSKVITEVDLARLFTLFNEIGIISQLSSNAFERAMPDGMTLSQFTVLNWFTRVDQVASPGRLASALMVSKGAMTNTLKKLAQKQFVEVVVDSNNGREKRVSLTAQGVEQHARCLQSASQLMHSVSSNVDLADLDEQISQLQLIRKFLDEHRNT